MTETHKIQVAIYWCDSTDPGYGIGEPFRTMEEAIAYARKLYEGGYGNPTPDGRKREIHILETLVKKTVFEPDV